ncbi:MAG: tRNA (adenosine(37)-N6)-threonylcarbamoyltransferase complex dimerization subunit type 1 TsaB [Candidatus Omnitrophica bacterium]|nr:tRNA (adenosine(37)-N6)-threonylcarbamoyltransferase complex dimerization subunit type 1 TsaB [Candidatus Omnitrophota bacterium]MBU4473112.1 tRNA (adenosine(37)-N6)-threonylcarbamoyltransferase complex dimerization subunit type 1 TsaB [Candidatus Omnitrophota bacterium]
MRILGIDTTTRFLVLGIYDNLNVYEYSLEVGTRLSSLLAETIKRVLDVLGWQAGSIDYFACGLGPGSFTGMRVGIAAIKGLAWSLNKPVVGVPTLDILARNINLTDRYVIPALDAKRGLIYCSVYKSKGQALKRITPYMLLSQGEFFKKAKNNSIIFGDAVTLYQEKILNNIKGVSILDKDYWYPKPSNIIALALERIKDKKANTPFEIKPIYLYPKECQIRNIQKLKSK